MSRRRRAQDRLAAASPRRIAVGLGLTVATVGAVLAAEVVGVRTLTTEASAVVLDLFDAYGLPALFGAFVFEGLMLLYLAPSESLVPAAVLAFGDDPATLAVVVGVAVAGATLGQACLFVVVRRAGREAVLERRFGVSEARLARFDAWFGRWGPLAVPVSNALLFVRGMATVPAGLSDMRLRTFVLLSAAGTCCFEVALAALTLGVLGAV